LLCTGECSGWTCGGISSQKGITKVSLAELLKCFGHPISEEQAWAICFQCCRKIEQLGQGLCPPLYSVSAQSFGSRELL
uniref:KIND domain-containing protein n=1 Tax=Malurus cyaneus samueli TaxID=2593467 RepID=A0A8C5U991_9PASS